jgi:hypothetical protein
VTDLPRERVVAGMDRIALLAEGRTIDVMVESPGEPEHTAASVPPFYRR